MSTEVGNFYQQANWKPTCITYSYADNWYRNKSAFRSKYYTGEAPKKVAQFEYGSMISDLIKTDPGNPLLAKLPRYSCVDEEYEVMLGDVRFVFHPDMFEPSTFSFREVKTGMRTSSGKPSWDQKKVNKHKQLDCYSMGIEMLFGEVNETCHLDWLVKEKPQVEIIDGIMGEGEPVCTGEVVSFERVITPMERYAVKEWLLQAYYEIVADYQNHLKNV